MNLRVGVNKSRLQSSLDFCLEITSMSKYKDLESLRKGMFKKFMEEERSRESSYLLSKEDDAIELAREQEERLEGEIVSCDIVGHGVFLEDYVPETLVEEQRESNIGEAVFTGKSFLDAVKNATQVDSKESLKIKETTMGSKNFLDAVKNIEKEVSKGSVERVNHGRYLEDYEEEEVKEYKDFEEVSEIKGVKSDIVESLERVDHGIYLEDYVLDDVEENVSNDFVEVEEQVNDTSDYLEEEDIEDISDRMDPLFDSCKKGESDVVKEKEEVFEEFIENKDSRTEEYNRLNDEKVVSYEMIVDSVQQPIQNNEMTFKKEEVEEEITEEEEVIVKPANIRDFIKQHPGSSIEYVMRYYSKKEIDKALALGKIYKKNGKLCI